MPTLELHRRTAVQFAHRHLTARLVCETSLCLLQALAKHALKLKSMHWITRECAGWFSLIWAMATALAVQRRQVEAFRRSAHDDIGDDQDSGCCFCTGRGCVEDMPVRGSEFGVAESRFVCGSEVRCCRLPGFL